MRTLLIAAAFAALSISAAYADDPLASRYGNTTIFKDSSGLETHLYYAADGTFSGKQGDASFKGTWTIHFSIVCLTATTAIPNLPNPSCVPVSARKVGETWTAGSYTISLVQGIQ